MMHDGRFDGWQALAVGLCCLTGCAEHQPLAVRGPALELERVPVQYDDYVRDTFAISATEWREVRGLFEPPADNAALERARIREAVGMLERIAGAQTPTHRDKAKNNQSLTGAMDCIDESTNTTTYLRLLQEQGLLRWHEVMGKAFRGPLELDTHWTAQVRDLTTGARYAVDSWYLDNGQPPYVQMMEDWKRKKPFPEEQIMNTLDAGGAE